MAVNPFDFAYATAGLPDLDAIEKASGWARPPLSLGQVLSDEVYRITEARGLEPVVLTQQEQTRIVQAASLWMDG